MTGLSYEQLAQAYEARHGGERPTPWKLVARMFPGYSVGALVTAISRLERRGLNRDANGRKPLTNPTRISDRDLALIVEARNAGYTWPAIAAMMRMNENTIASRYRRWRATQ